MLGGQQVLGIEPPLRSRDRGRVRALLLSLRRSCCITCLRRGLRGGQGQILLVQPPCWACPPPGAAMAGGGNGGEGGGLLSPA